MTGTSDPRNPGGRRPRKRGHGEGTISRRKDGAWQGSVMVGYRADGKPDRRYVYGRTRAEVQRKLNELRQRRERGQLGDPAAGSTTLGAFVSRYLAAARSTLRPRTWRRYDELLRLHVVPALGRTRLDALRPDAVQRLYAAKLEAGLSPRTVRHVHRVLHTALSRAVRWRYVPANVTDAVDAPAVPEAEIAPPSPDQLGRLLDTAHAAGDRLAPLWTVAVYSGCREGELLGLRWGDVDLARGTLAVRRALVGARGGVPQFGAPKTGRSRRTVTLPAEAIEALLAQRERQQRERRRLGPDYADYGLVFASHLGTPLLVRNVIRGFKAALARAGLPGHYRVHDLRHAAATLMLAAGVHPKVASARLGHSTVGITLDLYTHSVEGLDADAAERIQRAVRGPRAEGSEGAATTTPPVEPPRPDRPPAPEDSPDSPPE
jgi:integrase